MSAQEKKNKTRAALYTVAVNIVVFLILFFAAAWKTAGSGDGDYPGIEVNLGYDDQGSGDIQPDEPVGDEKATDDESAPTESVSEPVEESGEAQETVTPQETAPTENVQTETVTDPTSDVVIKEEPKKVVEKPMEKTPVPVEKPAEKKVVEQPKVDQTAVYKAKTTTSTSSTGEGDGKQGVAGNQGDDTGKVGDKGVPGGTEGAAIYKGTPGGGDGGSIVLNGWDWGAIEKPKVPSNETGQVVFDIEVDDNGDLITYKKRSGSVSPTAERACVAALQKIEFTKKPNAKVPPITKGTITFVIRAE